MADLDAIADSLIRGQAPEVESGVKGALDEGVPVREILHGALIKGMEVVGQRFKNNEFYIPEVLIAARAMKTGLELIRPKLIEEEVEPLGKAVIGTVKGDLHDIGKNLVGIMYETVGFRVKDLGIDVGTEKFIETIEELNPRIVSLSSLLTTTMENQKETLKEIKALYGDKVKVLVGGAPVTQEWADSIGADGFAKDCFGAAMIAKKNANT